MTAAIAPTGPAPGDPQQVSVRDVSQGGAFVTASSPQPVGTELKIRMSMPGAEAEEEQLDGRVVRVVEVEGDQMPDHITGMGIEFKLTPEQRAKLRRVLMSYVGDQD